MPRDFIKVDRTQTGQKFAAKLQDAIGTARRLHELLEEIKALMDHNTDATVWTDIELYFGLPTGSGQSVYNLVAGGLSAVQGGSQTSDLMTLIDRVG